MVRFEHLVCERKLKTGEIEARIDICDKSEAVRTGYFSKCLLIEMKNGIIYLNCNYANIFGRDSITHNKSSLEKVQTSEISKRRPEIMAIVIQERMQEKCHQSKQITNKN